MSDDSDEDSEGPPPQWTARNKWWNVPDAHIEALVGLPSAPALTSQLANVGSNNRRKTRVRFDGPHEEDALDSLLRRTQDRLQSGSAPELGEKGARSWKVSDKQIEQLVLKMASSAQQPPPPPSQAFGSRSSNASRSSLGFAGTAATCSLPADGRIDVWVFIMDSEDYIRLRVPLDLQIGPPPTPKANRFTDMYGLGASTKGFALVKHTFDTRYRKFTPANAEDWIPEWSSSLKSMVEEYCEIEVSRQRLYHRNSPMSDTLTLRSYMVQHGDVLYLRIQRWVPGVRACGRDEVSLATTSKALGMKDKRNERTKYEGYSMRNCKRLKEFRKADGEVYMQPKWLIESDPAIFCKVGAGVSGTGLYTVMPHPLDNPIFIQDRDNPRLQKVRIAMKERAREFANSPSRKRHGIAS